MNLSQDSFIVGIWESSTLSLNEISVACQVVTYSTLSYSCCDTIWFLPEPSIILFRCHIYLSVKLVSGTIILQIPLTIELKWTYVNCWYLTCNTNLMKYTNSDDCTVVFTSCIFFKTIFNLMKYINKRFFGYSCMYSYLLGSLKIYTRFLKIYIHKLHNSSQSVRQIQ